MKIFFKYLFVKHSEYSISKYIEGFKSLSINMFINHFRDRFVKIHVFFKCLMNILTSYLLNKFYLYKIDIFDISIRCEKCSKLHYNSLHVREFLLIFTSIILITYVTCSVHLVNFGQIKYPKITNTHLK